MLGAAMGIADKAMGMVTAGMENQRNRENTKDSIKWQEDSAMKLSEFNRKQQMKMWEDTNHKAQVEQMQKAGLNVGLMYGGGGGTGATVNASNSTGASGSVAPYQINEGMGIAASMVQAEQMKNMEAQRKLTEAQTQKTNVETEKIGGVDTEEGRARITKLGQDVAQGQAETQFMNAKTAMQTMQNTEQLATQEARISHVRANAQKAVAEMEIAKNESKISEQTYKSQIKIIQEEAIQAVLKNELTSEQTRAISVQLAQEWEKLSGQVSQREIERVKTKVMWELGKMNIEQRRAEMMADAATSVLRGAQGAKDRQAEREFKEREADRHQGNYERDKGW